MKTRLLKVLCLALMLTLMFGGTANASAGAIGVQDVQTVTSRSDSAIPAKKNASGSSAVGKATGLTYVYASASTSSKKLLPLGKNNMMDVPGVSGSYYKVVAAGKTGYVPKSYVSIVSGTVPGATTTSSKSSAATAASAVGKATGLTYVYASASTSSKKLLPLGKNNMMNVPGVSGSYYKVVAAGKTGYVPKSYVSIVSGKVSGASTTSSKSSAATAASAVGKATGLTYVYASASTSSKKLLPLGKNNMMNVPGVSGSYYKVVAAGKAGYVPKSYVSIVSGKVSGASTTSSKSSAAIAKGTPSASTYLYASASTSSQKLMRLYSTNTVDILSSSGSFYKVAFVGKTGYALKSKIAVAGAKSTSTPAATATPKPSATATPKPTATATPTPALDTAGWYTIDNAQFGIKNNGTGARATTDGINQALTWAKSKGYTKVKFPAGTYLIQCNWNNRYIAPDDGILVPSGMTLDLGSSTFKLEANSYPAYSIFSVVGKSNVTITGGTLIGDLGQHVYAASSDSETHEWGFGICISASTNVLVSGVTIKNMTGDGVILEGSYASLANGGKVCSNVRVTGCDISSCRRQGISVIGATNSELAQNRIYGISGTDPQYGIDVETEFDYVVSGLKIHNNTISGCTGGAINCNKGSNYEVYSNTCIGNNIIAVQCSNVKIYGNTIQNSFIRVMTYSSGVTVENNSLDSKSWVYYG